MATAGAIPCGGGVGADGSVVGVGIEGGIEVPTGVASGVATAGGAGGWGVVMATVGVGARVGWSRTGSGVGNRSGLGGGAVARAGWMVAEAVFEGWVGLAASGGSAWAVAAAEIGATGDATGTGSAGTCRCRTLK